MEQRREREKEEMKELILSAASEIVAAQGLNQLSIRSIAKEIEYSPSIIYHYFRDKEEIVTQIMQRGYKKIVRAVSSVSVGSAEEKLIQMTKNYIAAALAMPDEFMAVQLNQSKEIQNHTSSLFQGASKEKPALRVLYLCLKEFYQAEPIEDITVELTAQMIVVSSLGLIIKLITENIGEEQKEKLVHFYTTKVVVAIAKGTYSSKEEEIN